MKRLLHFEWKKLLIARPLILILIFFTVLNGWKIYDLRKQSSWLADAPGWEKAYWRLYPDYAGEITPEKMNHLMDIYKPLAAEVQDMTFSRDSSPDAITGINKFSDYIFLSQYYVNPYQRFMEYGPMAQSILAQSRDNIVLFNTLGNPYGMRENARIYQMFAGRTVDVFAYTEMCARLTHYTFSTLLMALVCIYAWTLLYAREKDSEMDMLLLTMENGTLKTAAAKMMVGGLFTFAIVLWFTCNDFLFFSLFYQTFAGVQLPVYALSDFALSPIGIDVWAYLCVLAVTKTVGLCALGTVYSLLVIRGKNTLRCFVLGSGVLFLLFGLAELTTNVSNLWLKVLNPASLLIGYSLFRKTEFLNFFQHPVLSYEVAVLYGVLLIVSIQCIILRRASHHGFAKNRAKPTVLTQGVC